MLAISSMAHLSWWGHAHPGTYTMTPGLVTIVCSIDCILPGVDAKIFPRTTSIFCTQATWTDVPLFCLFIYSVSFISQSLSLAPFATPCLGDRPGYLESLYTVLGWLWLWFVIFAVGLIKKISQIWNRAFSTSFLTVFLMRRDHYKWNVSGYVLCLHKIWICDMEYQVFWVGCLNQLGVSVLNFPVDLYIDI